MSEGFSCIASNRSFNGWHKRFCHTSSVLNCEMTFAVYLPPDTPSANHLPVVYWLSGLTCTDENFMQKAGAQRIAGELGIVLVAPDTSPRGVGVADDEAGGYDLGLGAGFYVNATQSPWSKHYRMHDYVVEELPALIEDHFPVSHKRGIAGHSMGGHGALVCALRNPGRYQSVSAFSPITHPVNCPWGEKAFSHYLGADRNLWQQWDSCCLLREAKERLPILIDQGEDDEFLLSQLKPDALVEAAEQADYPITLRRHVGYDHSYYFIASFIEDHFRHHASVLKT